MSHRTQHVARMLTLAGVIAGEEYRHGGATIRAIDIRGVGRHYEVTFRSNWTAYPLAADAVAAFLFVSGGDAAGDGGQGRPWRRRAA